MTNQTMTDDQFTALLEAADPEQFHAFALAVWDSAWADARDETPRLLLDDKLARFVEQVAVEHGAMHAKRQVWEVPVWLEQLGGGDTGIAGERIGAAGAS